MCVMPVVQQPAFMVIYKHSAEIRSRNTRAQSMCPFSPTHDMRGTAINQLSQDAQSTTGAAHDMNRSITRTCRPTDTCQGVLPSLPPEEVGSADSYILERSRGFPAIRKSVWPRPDGLNQCKLLPYSQNTHRRATSWGGIHTFVGTREQQSWVKMPGKALYLCDITPGSPSQACFRYPDVHT